MVQTIAESLIAQGRDEGLGLADRDTLRRLLTLRFGTLPEPVMQRIQQATDRERLKAAIDGVLRMTSLEELSL